MSLRTEVIKIINQFLANSKKISALTDADPVDGSELVEIVQDGVNKKATVSDLAGSASIPTQWDFVSEGGFPVDTTKIYVSIDATDSVYPYGTLFWSNGSGGWFTK